MQKVVDAALDKVGDDLRTEMADADDELRGHLQHVLGGSVRDWIGVALLAVGICLAVTGSIVGTSCG